ncbi:MAG: hypothetical protein ACKOZU_00590 [Planctomycetaceae bacterium]
MRPTPSATRRVAWLALACHVLVASGLPLPLAVTPPEGGSDAAARLAAKDRSRPFPCMDKPCGCASAEQCFAACCCHTPVERLAWARARDVEPAVLAALERRVRAATPTVGGHAPHAAASCCAARETPSPSLDGPDVCSAYRSLAAAPAAPPAVAPTPADDDVPAGPAPRTVILRDMLACGGIATAWLACGTALPPPPRTQPPVHNAPAGAIAPRDEFASSVFADLSAPPPRVG